MNILSLFDGISVARVALEKANIKVDKYYASEIDKYAMQVSNKNYPDIIQIGDVKDVDTSKLPKIDLLVFGSPCQGFSFSGKQLNFNDPRSKLFFEAVRILKELRLKNPKILFLAENVKMKKEYENVITEHLGVEPILINSELVSAQMRKRLYWSNIPNVVQPEDRNIRLVDIIESGYVDKDKSYCIDANYFKGGNLEQYFHKSRRQLVFTSIPDENGNINTDKFRMLTPIECELLQTLEPGYTSGISNMQRYKCLGNGFTVDVIAHIFNNIDSCFKNIEFQNVA